MALPDGSRDVRAHAALAVDTLDAAEQLGAAVAGDLLARGAEDVLAALAAAGPT
ncbi:hypothetical protein D3C72_1270190 [compost metagenome]